MKKATLFLLLFLVSCILPAQVTDTDGVRGNWFDAAEGGWALGIYGSVAIVDNHVYDIRYTEQHGKALKLTLVDKDTRIVNIVTLTPKRDGTLRMKQGKKLRRLTRLAGQPRVPADKGYDQFFRTDTAIVQGYIEGYSRELGFETGTVYTDDITTNNSFPRVVEIAPDGTFTCKLPMSYPAVQTIYANGQFIYFFASPGTTQTIYINWPALVGEQGTDGKEPMLYMGEDAHLSRLSKDLGNLLHYSYVKISRAADTQAPMQFRESIRPDVAEWQHIGDSLAAMYAPSERAVKLIRHSVALREGCTLLEYDMLRGIRRNNDEEGKNEVLKVEAGKDFYDFLEHMPIDEPEMLACSQADMFTNRYEFMEILWTVKNRGMGYDSNLPAKEVDRMRLDTLAAELTREDSLMALLCGKERPFLWQVAGVRQAKNRMESYDTYEGRKEYVDLMKARAEEHPALVEKLDRLYADKLAEERAKSYELPASKEADIFRNIIKNHPGKVLVDWATTCGPCRWGIQNTAELRHKYKDHPDVKFIYITSEDESPLDAYNAYVEQHLKGEACYRISATDFAYLRQLFKFSGIPHYELVEKDGTISVEKLDVISLYNYLEERFPMPEEEQDKENKASEQEGE